MENTGTKRLDENTIKSAIKLVFAGKQIENHALLEINKAIQNYEATKEPKEPNDKKK